MTPGHPAREQQGQTLKYIHGAQTSLPGPHAGDPGHPSAEPSFTPTDPVGGLRWERSCMRAEERLEGAGHKPGDLGATSSW